MASMTNRNIDVPLKGRLRLRAAQNGHSMEQEAPQILTAALIDNDLQDIHLVEEIRRRFAPFGGVDLEIPPHEMGREPPDFGA